MSQITDEMLSVMLREQGFLKRKTPGFASDEDCDGLRESFEKVVKDFEEAIIDVDFVATVESLLKIKLYAEIAMLSFGIDQNRLYSEVTFLGLATGRDENRVRDLLIEQGWNEPPNT